ncbi:ATP-dependent helicase YprA (DUF1998 family) [Evansella vedderi]|uniref:ATP-dependent helicase YprA (DUF1998 family) n=1 Tax=Evansella vedderi TaxID=38282 RepID=A0ABU0A4A5_9BACI|nr:DEAD/DEAH box helicase [Evansella vedderi]MDQ0257513.1 ATP-dependent helicase YprA (DUF1998 family) [Evansella vedderi]
MVNKLINPIKFANQVNEQFLNYQLTAFPLTDSDLASQARTLIKGSLGHSPLIKGPYVSLSKFFRVGRNLFDLARTGEVHPALPGLTEFPTLFAHQDKALEYIKADSHCLIATGTGSGKTESFLYPILDHCLRLRDQGTPDGVVAILVYPMNALATDQLDRLRKMLVGSGVSFGMYVGSTPSDESELENVIKMREGEGREELVNYTNQYSQHKNIVISPPEERITEKEMRDRPPRLLLTNVNQLELLLTRGKDLGMFLNAPLKYLVFDEAHTYSGAVGAEVSCLIRRLRTFCGKTADEIVCIGTSATVTDPTDTGENVAQFAQRFFGVDPHRVTLVKEEYQKEQFPDSRYLPNYSKDQITGLLEKVLLTLENDNIHDLQIVYKELTGVEIELEKSTWKQTLFEDFKKNEYIYALLQGLNQPYHITDAVKMINKYLERPYDNIEEWMKEELLCYLALGAAVEKNENPLLRPKIHYFVKGLEGAVITFNEDYKGNIRSNLSLSVDEALEKDNVERTACFPVLVCKHCGQHYLEGYYPNISFQSGLMVGGDAEEDNVIWIPTDEAEGGKRLLFTTNLISDSDDELIIESKGKKKASKKRSVHYICRCCGTIHRNQGECLNNKCKVNGKLVPIWVIHSEEGLSSCLSCGQRGRKIGERLIEPIREFKATTAADVHILAQNMMNSENEGKEQKLIVFSDNRQDAAFQSGWMKDRARRYHFRHIIYDYLRDKIEPTSIGDIELYLMEIFKEDKALGQTLAPEVYTARRSEAFGRGLENLLTKFLRITLLREFTTSFKQKDSLETWGKTRVVYAGINEEQPWVHEWSTKLNISNSMLVEGISSLLDSYRRTRILWDQKEDIYSHYWHESSDEVQQGFIPMMDFPPVGLKRFKEENDSSGNIKYFVTEKAQTKSMEFVTKWGIPRDKVKEFLEELWFFLTDTTKILTPVSLKSAKGRQIRGTNGVFQINSDQLGIVPQNFRYRCDTCQQIHTRNAPNGACSGWQCKGILKEESLPKDDYNINLLEKKFNMLMAEEHSAQVPAKNREYVEEEFKKELGKVNCLVATPTLEMGVDIGALDMVLMRNVPPKSANYWQRAGRAGRRHRMAVIYTYCRRSEHDRYFYYDPVKMLSGHIDTPRFNLRNEVMIRKHIHATIISEIIRLSRSTSNNISQIEKEMLEDIRKSIFPNYIKDYLFVDENNYRNTPYDVNNLSVVIEKYNDLFIKAGNDVFTSYWPEEDRSTVNNEMLVQFINEMPVLLQEVVNRLHKRMMWAKNKLDTLISEETNRLLDPSEERLKTRCSNYLKKLSKSEMGTYTLSVLATEGFLPGYGTYEGSLKAFANRSPFNRTSRPDFELPRASTIAIREFVPGNMIYANNGRFKTRFYHLPVGQQQLEPDRYIVDIERERVIEAKRVDEQDGSYGNQENFLLSGIPISDVDLAYLSRISDEEDNRFQLPVSVMGFLKEIHRGVKHYDVGFESVQHRFGQHVRLINVGPADLVKQGELGFPVCSVCGGARSPYASNREINDFEEHHNKICGKKPNKVAFTADANVDGLMITGLKNKPEAVNLGEALRIGAGIILEMERDDLQFLIIPEQDDSYTLFLYDPMPGGSGLLQQMLNKWSNLISSAVEHLTGCISQCEASCYYCMRSYRNVFFHSLLDRNLASVILQRFDNKPEFDKEIDPIVAVDFSENSNQGNPTNSGEYRLEKILERAGFPKFEHQNELNIGPPFHKTTPDLYYGDENEEIYVAIYLDGLSKGIHGNSEREQIDNTIRQQLEAEDINVISIATSHLDDPEILKTQLKIIANKLRRRDLRNKVTEDNSWFC